MEKIFQRMSPRLLNLIPYIIGSALFIVTPTVLLLVKATKNSSSGIQDSVIHDHTMWDALIRSSYLGIIASIISLVLIFPFTWVVARANSKAFKITAIALMVSPLFIFTVVKVLSLKVLLLKVMDDEILEAKQQWLVMGMVYIYSPFMIVPLYSVIKTLPENLLNASNDLGSSPIRTVFKVALPYCLKAIFAGVAMVFMLSATTLVMSHTLVDYGMSTDHTKMIGNVIDVTAKNINLSEYSSIRSSTIALITIGVMVSIYGFIYFAPQVWRKIRGGVNV